MHYRCNASRHRSRLGGCHSARVGEAQRIVARLANCTLHEALVRMRNTAAVTGETVDQIAQGVNDGRIRFDLDL